MGGATLAGRPIVGIGRTAEVVAWEDGVVAKVFHDFAPAEYVEAEAAAAAHVSGTDVPAPGFLGRIEVEGRQALLFERVEGRTLLHTLTSRPWQTPRLSRTMAELHARIHEHDGHPLPDVRERLRAHIGLVDFLPPASRSAALAALDRLPEGGALCHFDLHPDQVLLGADGPVVIDWTNAHRGRPAADVARTTLILTFGIPPQGRPHELALAAVGRRLVLGTYRRRYARLRPDVDPAEIDAWMVPMAAARLSEGLENERRGLLEFVEQSV